MTSWDYMVPNYWGPYMDEGQTMPTTADTDRHVRHAATLKIAEEKIQRTLINLEEETGCEIDAVQVDTRQFANLKPEIFLR